MSSEPPKPLHVLYGHKDKVTTAVFIKNHSSNIYHLYSCDDNGTVIIWDLSTCKSVSKKENLVDGRIQSIFTLFKQSFIAIQSRLGKIFIYNQDLSELMLTFKACDNNFNKAVSIDLDENTSVISYTPSRNTFSLLILNCKLETVAHETSQSISDLSDTTAIFDTRILVFDKQKQQVLVFVGYENGLVSVFKYDKNRLSRIKIYDMKQNDFVSSLDVIFSKTSDARFKIVCGFPFNKFFIINDSLSNLSNFRIEPESHQVKEIELGCEKTKGVSAVKFRPDGKILSLATWNNKLKIYSSKGKFLANLDYHSQKINDICFIEIFNISDYLLFEQYDGKSRVYDKKETMYLMACSSSDFTISLSTIY